MERLWADSSGQDSYDPYTCAVKAALFLECLDIAGPRTLGNSLSDAVAYNMSGSSGDLNKNFYAVLALEGLFSMSGPNVTGHFGGDVSCSGKVVGDGAVNAYDVAALMWYQFKFEPYDQLANDPSTVATVQGRDDTSYRCGLGETRRMWQIALGDDYCHNGQNAALLGYDSQRRLSQGTVEERGILSTNLFQAYRSDAVRPQARQLESYGADTVPRSANARENRTPEARRSLVNQEDMLRHVNAMRALDVDVAEWGVVEGYGRWIRIRAPGVQVAMELYLAGIAVDEPVHLSMQGVPAKNCTMCKPTDEDPRNVVIAFARRTEYEDEYANAVANTQKQICANIVPATLQSSVMVGNTIALRQQPPNKACGFDLFVWIPAFPANGVHISKQTHPYSYSARRLAAVGAESPFTSQDSGCENDIGVLSGSSALDGFRGQIQRVISCTRYGITQPQLIVPVLPLVPVNQGQANQTSCYATCNRNAPTRSDFMSRSFHIFTSSGLEDAYTESLQILTTKPRGGRLNTYESSLGEFISFEMSLAREAKSNDCCSGYECVTTMTANGTTGTCQPTAPTIPPSSPGMPSPMASSDINLVTKVLFNVTLENTSATFDASSFKNNLASAINVSVSQINVIVSGSVVYSTIITLDTQSPTTIANNVDNKVLKNVTIATLLLGVDVIGVGVATIVTEQASPPTPPPASPSDDNDAVMLIIIISSSVVAATACALLLVLFIATREKSNKVEPEARSLLAGNGGVPINRAAYSGLEAEVLMKKTPQQNNANFRF